MRASARARGARRRARSAALAHDRDDGHRRRSTRAPRSTTQRAVAPLLAGIAERDRAVAAPARRRDRALRRGGRLRPARRASPALRRLRKELRDGRQRVTEELRKLGADVAPAGAPAGGLRHRARRPARVRGEGELAAQRARDRPRRLGVGQTLFVEPFEVVELNNRQSEAASAEREEVARILRELSASVGARAAELDALVEATGAIDLAVACAALSRRWRGAPVDGLRTRCGCSARGTRCSTRRRRCRSTSTSATCARS